MITGQGIKECLAQNYGLKIIQVSDSSLITRDLQFFDSLWYQCMKSYGKEDVSSLFADDHRDVSKTNPITLLNFIGGFDAPFSDVFGFKLVQSQILNDSLIIYQLDMGWMQIAMLYHRKANKLMRYESLNGFKLIKSRFKNITVCSISEVPKNELVNSYKQITKAMKDLGLNEDSFCSKDFILYSANNLKEAYAYVGGLEYVNFFIPGARYGGMGDPYNKVILSGIPRAVHVHELMHFAITFPCNGFVGEGLASYYGGVGAYPYDENLQNILKLVRSKGIHSFSEVMSLWRSEPYFNDVRGSYLLAAFMLDRIKKDFGQEKYRNFVRNCKTYEEMIASLEKLYILDSEKEVFDQLYWSN